MKFENKIYKTDCIKGLKKLPDNSIDIIITSPPYNLGNSHHTGNKKHFPYEDNMKEIDYQLWQKDFLNECYRVLKEDGSMFYNHKNRIKNGLQISPYEWLLKTNFLVKQEIVWVNRSQNFDKIRFYPWTERIYWLVKNNKTKLINNINHHDVFDWKEWKPVGTRLSHTRSFPVKMIIDILSCFPDAKIVLDPFMGSGTTAIGSIRTNKKYLGFELVKEYVDLAKKNIKHEQKEKK